MPSAISRHLKHKRSRKQNPIANRPQPVAALPIASATAVGLILTLNFDEPVTLDGVPGFTTDVAGPEPVSAQKTAPNTVEITFSAAIAAATSINIPFRDPAIRNASGGYVVSNTFPV